MKIMKIVLFNLFGIFASVLNVSAAAAPTVADFKKDKVTLAQCYFLSNCCAATPSVDVIIGELRDVARSTHTDIPSLVRAKFSAARSFKIPVADFFGFDYASGRAKIMTQYFRDFYRTLMTDHGLPDEVKNPQFVASVLVGFIQSILMSPGTLRDEFIGTYSLDINSGLFRGLRGMEGWSRTITDREGGFLSRGLLDDEITRLLPTYLGSSFEKERRERAEAIVAAKGSTLTAKIMTGLLIVATIVYVVNELSIGWDKRTA